MFYLHSGIAGRELSRVRVGHTDVLIQYEESVIELLVLLYHSEEVAGVRGIALQEAMRLTIPYI